MLGKTGPTHLEGEEFPQTVTEGKTLSGYLQCTGSYRRAGFNNSQAFPPKEATGGSYLPKSELSHVLDNILSLVALEIKAVYRDI